ncbi:MAG: hypothetical protein ACLRIO_04070 [Butyricicoccus sp.]
MRAHARAFAQGDPLRSVLLLLQTAVIALIVGAVSVKGFGDTVTGSPADDHARSRLRRCLSARDRRAASYERLAIRQAADRCGCRYRGRDHHLSDRALVTGAYTFGTEAIRRTADLPGRRLHAECGCLRAGKRACCVQNTNNLCRITKPTFANASTDNDITFTVPEDSKSCSSTFLRSGVTINTATYTGAKDGSVKLGYKLLPASLQTVFRT